MNENQIFIENYWPTSIIYTDHPNPNSLNFDVEKKIYKWMESDEGVRRSNKGGWHSTSDMHQKEEFNDICEWITNQVSRVIENLYLSNNTHMIMNEMWANVNRKGDYNLLHTHPQSHISGVYYIRTPLPKQSRIWFFDPRHANKHFPISHDAKKIVEEGHSHLWPEVHFTPKAGRLILFPSYLEHSVDPNTSNEDRISLSFNFHQIKKN